MDKARKEDIKSAYIRSISGVIGKAGWRKEVLYSSCLLYTSPSPRD